MIVVDSGPLNFLIRVNAEVLLTQLFDEAFIPHEVKLELSRESTPIQVRDWLQTPPSWVRLGSPRPQLVSQSSLHAGELSVLLDAKLLGGALVLLDDKKARIEAERRNLRVTGTLAVLYKAGTLGLIDFERALSELVGLRFRMSGEIQQTYLQRWRDFRTHS